MKINQPVTEIEKEMSEDTLIVSKTDLKGTITYVNQAFIDISGFSEQELMGKNHNIVRHPDVPPAAFQDLWDTIQAGKPWTGIVKNRCKNGDHYWVKANVTPLMKNGRIAEYMSVRTRPSRNEINDAAKLYTQINTGKLPKPNLLQRLNFVSKLKIWHKLGLAFLLTFIVTALLAVNLILSSGKGIQFADNEIQGISYLSAIRQIMQNMPQHRGMTNAYLNGNTALESKILKKRAQVDENFQALMQLDSEMDGALRVTDQLKQVNDKWDTLKQQAFKLPASESFSRHTTLLHEIIAVMEEVGKNSGLTFDPVYESNSIIENLVERIPVMTEQMGQSRGLGAGIVSRGSFNPGQKDRLIGLQVRAKHMSQGIRTSIASVFKDNPDIEARLNDKVNKANQALAGFENDVDNLLRERFSGVRSTEFFDKGTAAINVSFELYDEATQLLRELLEQRREDLSSQQMGVILVVVVGVIIAMLVVAAVIVSLRRSLQDTAKEFEYLSDGDYKRDIEIRQPDEVGDLLRSLKSMQIKLGFDINDAKQRADSMQRIMSALDNVSANVMVADASNHIIYANTSLIEMFKNAEADLREDLPKFDASSIVGSCMDIYHKNPAHQKSLVAALKESHNAQFVVGGRTMRFTANPVTNEQGERLGTVVEWQDRTNEVAVEKEVDAIVTAAQQGDLKQRIELEGKSGFFYQLSGRINLLINVIEESFGDMARVMNAMAEGDLTNRITEEYGGTFGEVKDSINKTADKLDEVIRSILTSSEFIKNASEEIVAGNNNLSKRAETQASTLEETASSMEELTSTVKNNAENAQLANRKSSGTKEIAEKGGVTVQNAVTAMQAIITASHKISEIIGVIDEIAFQTNLLALNASVEAARAGEQGRGFAVVATEVRNLAQRSATAAKEIKELISDSVHKIETGAELVNESGRMLEEIVGGVNEVTTLVGEIAAASDEQASGIEQVYKAVMQMDEMTQQNAALAEEAAASSESSLQRVSEMNNLVRFFRIREE